MGTNFKKEIIFGLLGLIVVIGGIVWATGQYKASMNAYTPTSQQAQQATAPATTEQTTQAVEKASSTILTVAEVAKHSSPSDCWFIVSNKVYNVTSYINSHPGGTMRITSNCGKDATQAYQTQGGKGSHSSSATAMLQTLYIGDLGATVQSNTQSIQPTQGAQTAPAQQRNSEENENE